MPCCCDAFKALVSPWIFQWQLQTLALISCYQVLSSFSKHNRRYQSVPQLARVALAVAQRGVKYLFPNLAAGHDWCVPVTETASREKDLREAEPFLGLNSVRIR